VTLAIAQRLQLALPARPAERLDRVAALLARPGLDRRQPRRQPLAATLTGADRDPADPRRRIDRDVGDGERPDAGVGAPHPQLLAAGAERRAQLDQAFLPPAAQDDRLEQRHDQRPRRLEVPRRHAGHGRRQAPAFRFQMTGARHQQGAFAVI